MRGHGADAGEFDVVVTDEPGDRLLGHGLGVAVDEEHLVPGWCQSLKYEHPQMWHVVVCDFVIRVIKKDIHIKTLRLKLSEGRSVSYHF